MKKVLIELTEENAGELSSQLREQGVEHRIIEAVVDDLKETHLSVLLRAEQFIRGFEGDELQEGVDQLLADLEFAIERELPF